MQLIYPRNGSRFVWLQDAVSKLTPVKIYLEIFVGGGGEIEKVTIPCIWNLHLSEVWINCSGQEVCFHISTPPWTILSTVFANGFCFIAIFTQKLVWAELVCASLCQCLLTLLMELLLSIFRIHLILFKKWCQTCLHTPLAQSTCKIREEQQFLVAKGSVLVQANAIFNCTGNSALYLHVMIN